MSDSGAADAPGSVRVLWSFAAPHRRALSLSLLLGLLGSLFDLAGPLAVKPVLDSLSGQLSLAWPLGILLALLVVGSAVTLLQSILLGTVAERIVLHAREGLVRRYFRATLAAATSRPTGELVTRVTSDTLLLREAASSSAVGLVNATIGLVGSLVLMAVLDLVLLGVTLGALAVAGVVVVSLLPAISAAQERAQRALGGMGGTLDGALRALRTVKAGGVEDRMTERVVADARDAARHGVTSVRREAVVWTVSYAGIQLAVIAILGVGAWRVSAGLLEVSSLVAFLLYAFNLYGPAYELSTNLTAVQSGVAAASRIREIQDLPLEVEPAAATTARTRPDGDRPRIELRGVTARYAADAEPALRAVDLTVPARGHTAVVGPSGSGKTTLLSLLLRFVEPHEGRLLLDGVDYRDLAPADIRRRFAYVEQDTPLVPGTVRENLALTRPSVGDDELWRVLDDVRLAPHVRSLPAGLDTPLSDTAMSGGQRQRIALARALLLTPDVLLLDEATAQVDAITEAAVTSCVRAHAEHASVITVAHRLSTVIDADRIVVLEAGRMRAGGRHDELLRSDELYRELVAALRIGDGPVDRTAAP